MNINSHIIKLAGRAELPEELDTSKNYRISLEGSIPKVELHDLENGQWDKVYTFKPIRVEVLKEGGKVLKLRDLRKRSQLLRSRLFKIWVDSQSEEPFEEYYDRIMFTLIQKVDEVVAILTTQ